MPDVPVPDIPESADLPPFLTSLLAAVVATPDDLDLRLHVAEQLLVHGRPELALEHCGRVLAARPGDASVLVLLQRVTGALAGGPDSAATKAREPGPAAPDLAPGFDWKAADEQLSDVVQPAFVSGRDDPAEPVAEDVERPDLRLADVGGMQQVKERLDLAFLGPMRNPTLQKMYGKSLAGGLLLYGPPGCGKTFLARALAGELGAKFYAVSLADVLDMYIGQSERNLHDIFEVARAHAPCVLFLDEVDALGQRRSQLRGNSAMRGTVNQLLTEMDSVGGRNEGVFVLGATNHPWDLDPALRRPGRFDRMLLVLPPDAPAREAILHHHLASRPLEGIDIGKLVKGTDGFSGADLAYLADTAAELAMADSIRTGDVRPIRMKDCADALAQIRPSTGPWLSTARNVATFGNADGDYDELLAYLKKRKLA